MFLLSAAPRALIIFQLLVLAFRFAPPQAPPPFTPSPASRVVISDSQLRTIRRECSEYVPGVPLQKLTPEWIPGRIFLSYFVGVILILAGVCLLVNKKARTAATSLGLTILLTVLWIYLPMLLAAPTDVVALNFFFDTLLFCGAILLLANSVALKDERRIEIKSNRLRLEV